VAIVTGASRGIGRAACLALADGGHSIIGIARDADALAAVGLEVESRGTPFQAMAMDLTEVDLRDVCRDAMSWRSRIDVLVNAAGVLIRKPDDAMTEDEWRRTFQLNVRVPYRLMDAIGAAMHEAGSGAIVNVTSVASAYVTGAPGPYQASKAALVQATRYFARRLAPRVRVNAVGPGYVETEMSGEWLAIPANREWVEARTPLGRVAEPMEIASTIAFLSSKSASYITGQHLLVDGGWSIE
jgi:NAD(P)-dependent dehydrogenase (short-subunit alcohol dehydrogenase family)